MELTETRYTTSNGIATVVLNRPEKLNAFTARMRKELIWIFKEADRDDAVRVIVVTGAGRAFCAGADLSSGPSTFDYQQREGRRLRTTEHRDGGGQVALSIFSCRKPVIAAINGHAVGIGITLTLSMDMRIVAEDAKIGFVFARRGVVPEACSSWFLPRIVGMAKATEWVYTGRTFLAKEATNTGLFNYILPKDQVIPKATEIAREIAQNTSAVSVALAKALLWHSPCEPDPQSAHLAESKCFYWAGRQLDAREGIRSFIEKRPPRFELSPTKDIPDFYPWWKETKV